ncbi:dihydroorotate dehydrogenase [Methanomicrobium antiquum]|uniref:Dihydroorotate dehydrogenase n=1 Tax=Methanomicrobium antiquum TaxID=487686 RepID=A0AAF0JKR3_9EURY|nr:dihydroorotate dehydrogenase [Methanomicrobium antiquum]MDD3977039.1 dihydroorotate dehydrogenase [Methanomicrobium sp.]WFN35844.1 dihydroorotate dehydrogenase [Methanomicrobium antiquum]
MVTLIREDNITAGGILMDNHLILAAGILGTTGASLNRMLSNGAGAVVTKSIGPSPKEGHKGPCVYVMDGAVLNAMGLPNPSSDFIEELNVLKDKPVIASIFGADPDEFHEVASWFKGKVRGFELNVSCPHAQGYGAQIGCNPGLVLECTRAVSRTGLPVWVKLTPNVTDIKESGIAAERGGASAVVAINTLKAMRISTDLRRPVLGNLTGGLSGPAIFPVALRCVFELYKALNIPVIGCGGVSSADNVIEMMMAGASAVEIGSAVLDRNDIFEKIAGDLYSEEGEKASDIIGCAHE